MNITKQVIINAANDCMNEKITAKTTERHIFRNYVIFDNFMKTCAQAINEDNSEIPAYCKENNINLFALLGYATQFMNTFEESFVSEDFTV